MKFISTVCALAAVACGVLAEKPEEAPKPDAPKPHKRRGHKAIKLHLAKRTKVEASTAQEPAAGETPVEATPSPETEAQIAEKLDEVVAPAANPTKTGAIDVNGPLPADFNVLFSQSVADAVDGANAADVKVLETNVVESVGTPLVEIIFSAPSATVDSVQEQSADGGSSLATGPLESFLVAKDNVHAVSTPPESPPSGVSLDTAMPYGTLEPFGREDTARELTESSIKESDSMVDQMERAEVAEEKRSVFRALTRLRGAAITSFDGVARSQTGNIDEYNMSHQWRKTHPLHHLAAEEADVKEWAFPNQGGN